MLRIESENKAFRAVCFNLLKCFVVVFVGFCNTEFTKTIL